MLATSLPGADAMAAFPGENGSIAFTRFAVNGGVFAVSPDGSGERVIGSGQSPAWSADGSRIAWSSGSRIRVANADGSGSFIVGPDDIPPADEASIRPRHPAWSPDGGRLAYDRLLVSCAGHQCFVFTLGIWVINVDGTGDTRLTEAGQNPAWSPDGTKIAFDSTEELFPGDIWVMNEDGTDAINLTSSEPEESEPNWSPDGTRIAYSSGPGFFQPRDVSLITAGGTPLGDVTDDPADDFAPAWSPDGTKIVFSSDRDGGGLIVADVAGTGVTRLTGPGQLDVDPDWQPLVGPRRDDFKNASHFCKAERRFLGEARFAARYGGGSHGKCVSANN